MTYHILLPLADGTLQPYTLNEPAMFDPPTGRLRSQLAYAAVHVVCDPLADINPILETAFDIPNPQANCGFREMYLNFTDVV